MIEPMNLKPRIEVHSEIKLVGKRIVMTFAHNRTGELWQSFMSKRGSVINTIGSDLYSVEVYNDTTFFNKFDASREFEKWATVRVTDQSNIPAGMEALTLREGLYAIFHYKGRARDAQSTYQTIYGVWVPNSKYQLDNRPHFALMGEKYKNDDVNSEEEIWIPILEK